MKISIMYIFPFKQKFKNTNIAPEFPQPHRQGPKLYKMRSVQWNDSKPLVTEYMEDKLSLFFLSFLFYERNGSRARLGWAIFEKICLFFFFFSVLLFISPPFPIGRMSLYHLLSRKTMLFQRHVMCQKYLLDALTGLSIPAAS